MKLYIAEKPSLGRAIADALPKPHQREDGYIRLGNGDCVSWCIGHLLEQAEPEAYNSQYKKWRQQDLPIIPEQWKLVAKTKTRKQLTVIKKLIKKADQIVHAGDPDREGQLLVDQVIAHSGLPKTKLNAVKRCLINDLNLPAVRKALTNLRDNRDFVPLSTSALARSRADWLYGINMTRSYTLQGQKVGYQGLLSVGRVQTPLLGLIVRRDQVIENFISHPFYEVLALLETSDKQYFKAKWQPSESCQTYMDEENRVLLKALAENVIKRIKGQIAEVSNVSRKNKSAAPPLPYNLSALQIDAAKRFNMSAQQALDGCQALYERHKLITYPRSDCRYLPNDHFHQAGNIIKAIEKNCSTLGTACKDANPDLKSKAWNNNKVDAHHAIIPTEKSLSGQRLSQQEKQLYELISRQYLCQFYPKQQYREEHIELSIAGGRFVAKSKQISDEGWTVLSKSAFKSAFKSALKKEPSSTKQQDNATPLQLPPLTKGDKLHCVKGELIEKQTQAPKHFTDASLLAAMTGISRFVKDPDIRKVLKETDGLGTEATRAGIIELLFKRDYITRSGKLIKATATGKALILSLPESATRADMTALWEAELAAISKRESNYEAFMKPLTTSLQGLIEQSATALPTGLKDLKPSPKMIKKRSKRRKGKRNYSA